VESDEAEEVFGDEVFEARSVEWDRQYVECQCCAARCNKERYKLNAKLTAKLDTYLHALHPSNLVRMRWRTRLMDLIRERGEIPTWSEGHQLQKRFRTFERLPKLVEERPES
jgi:hypothetical protein